MDDKSALLNQLRIDRGGPSAPSHTGKFWLAGIVAVLGIAAIAAWFWTQPGAVRVHTAAARAITGGASRAPSLMPPAMWSHAVRPRLASKITAKMVELDIEEGDLSKPDKSSPNSMTPIFARL